jgi:D-alanyl-D-alanine carboxypeptidase
MKKALVLVVIAVIAVGGWLVWQRQHLPENGHVLKTKGNQAADSFDKSAESLTQVGSPWLVVNKRRPLQPATYVPDDLVTPDVPLRLSQTAPEMRLRREAATALEALVAAARTEQDLRLMLSSAYRSYDYQKSLYNHYVTTQGQAEADTQSARPGHSEHQTGLAADLEPASRECEVEACFADTPEGKWLDANAHKYGYIIRYPEGKQQTTGYIYEPWHVRYVGKKLAAELHKQGNPTLEEFFDLDPAPDYD